MSQIVAGLGIAHTPSMGFAYDKGVAGDFPPGWEDWYIGTRPVAAWMEQVAPTMAVIIYNDHINYFDLGTIPTFALGMGSSFPQADEGFGLRDLPILTGDTDYAWAIARALGTAGFDLTYCQELELDHGVYSWAPYVFRRPWPLRVLPLAVNMLVQPVPTVSRLKALGAALAAAIAGDGRDERVLFVATGGMSHQIHGSRFGQTNSRFDRYFLATLGDDPEALEAIPPETLMKLAGTEALELTMWYAMRTALGHDVRTIYSYYSLPNITGCGVLCVEPGNGQVAAAGLRDGVC